jgi:hypothetical protein
MCVPFKVVGEALERNEWKEKEEVKALLLYEGMFTCWKSISC